MGRCSHNCVLRRLRDSPRVGSADFLRLLNRTDPLGLCEAQHHVSNMIDLAQSRASAHRVPPNEAAERRPHVLTNATRKRRSRAKKRSAWEEEEFRTNGPYARNIIEIQSRYPTLTPQEVRVCACIKLMMTSWQIAERLRVTEKSVENYRTRIKRKTNCPDHQLIHFIAKL